MSPIYSISIDDWSSTCVNCFREHHRIQNTVKPSKLLRLQNINEICVHRIIKRMMWVVFFLFTSINISIDFVSNWQPSPGSEQESPGTGAYRDRPHIANSISTHSMKVCWNSIRTSDPPGGYVNFVFFSYCQNRNIINQIVKYLQIIGTAKVIWPNGMNRITIVQLESIHINVEVVPLNEKCLIMCIEMVHVTKKNGMTMIREVDETWGKDTVTILVYSRNIKISNRPIYRRPDCRYSDTASVVSNAVINHYASFHRRPVNRVGSMNIIRHFYRHIIWNDKTFFFPKQSSNLLSATLCLVKELDYPSLEVVEHAVRCRLDELAAEWQKN